MLKDLLSPLFDAMERRTPPIKVMACVLVTIVPAVIAADAKWNFLPIFQPYKQWFYGWAVIIILLSGFVELARAVSARRRKRMTDPNLGRAKGFLTFGLSLSVCYAIVLQFVTKWSYGATADRILVILLFVAALVILYVLWTAFFCSAIRMLGADVPTSRTKQEISGIE